MIIQVTIFPSYIALKGMIIITWSKLHFLSKNEMKNGGRNFAIQKDKFMSLKNISIH